MSSIEIIVKRLKALKKLRKSIEKNERKIYEALKKDLNKPKFESLVGEVGFVLKEINFITKHLLEWSKPQKVKTDIVNFPAESYIYHQPYGVVLIFGPWNYPFHLALMPLVGAIAAGNTAVVKPSEFAPATSKIVKEIVTKTFESNYVTVIEGDKTVSEALLNIKFDKIFFTGNSNVGKIVMKKAAEHLTPVTLELGGKSPTIVLKDANLKMAAKRIVWGKFFNAGQTCVAPDYLCIDKEIYEKFKNILIKETKSYASIKNFENNYSKIINWNHFQRLRELIEESKVIFGGGCDEQRLFIYPTIVEAKETDSIMEDEIFGPILPILSFEKYEDMKNFIKSKPKPLALYIFTESEKHKQKILNDIQSGGVTINDTLIHLSSNHLPFGGIGESGMGTYHGRFSFEEFSQKRAVVDRKTYIELPLRYPPYSFAKFTTVKRLF